MKELKDLLVMMYLIFREQRLQMRLLKHQDKMVDYYIKYEDNNYSHKETNHFMRLLQGRILETKKELSTEC